MTFHELPLELYHTVAVVSPCIVCFNDLFNLNVFKIAAVLEIVIVV